MDSFIGGGSEIRAYKAYLNTQDTDEDIEIQIDEIIKLPTGEYKNG